MCCSLVLFLSVVAVLSPSMPMSAEAARDEHDVRNVMEHFDAYRRAQDAAKSPHSIQKTRSSGHARSRQSFVAELRSNARTCSGNRSARTLLCPPIFPSSEELS